MTATPQRNANHRLPFRVRFWGVRGSYPTTGSSTRGFGGNTSCVEVETAGRRLIFDAGTGIIPLGKLIGADGDARVPSFIFLEAALAFLNLSDPLLPTWGKILGDAFRENALLFGHWWWISFPALGILFVTVGFAFLGYAFDKILNPRLREE